MRAYRGSREYGRVRVAERFWMRLEPGRVMKERVEGFGDVVV